MGLDGLNNCFFRFVYREDFDFSCIRGCEQNVSGDECRAKFEDPDLRLGDVSNAFVVKAVVCFAGIVVKCQNDYISLVCNQKNVFAVNSRDWRLEAGDLFAQVDLESWPSHRKSVFTHFDSHTNFNTRFKWNLIPPARLFISNARVFKFQKSVKNFILEIIKSLIENE